MAKIKDEPKTEEPKKQSAEELKQALAADQQERFKLAQAEIAAICEKHKVNIIPQIVLSQGSVVANLQIVPTE